jgi:hypothetical protein
VRAGVRGSQHPRRILGDVGRQGRVEERHVGNSSYSETLSKLKKEAHVDTGRSVSTVLTHSRLAHFGVLKELEAVVEALKDGGEAVASAFRDKDITAFNLELNGELKAGLPK